jgi:hypothetical protein
MQDTIISYNQTKCGRGTRTPPRRGMAPGKVILIDFGKTR